MYILSDFTYVVNYDTDNGWTTLLDKLSKAPKITKDVEEALLRLKTADIANTKSAKDLGMQIGYTDEQFFKFAKQADLSGDVLQQYKEYVASSSTATAKFAATLKSVAANLAIMFAVSLAIKGIAWAYDEIVRRQENLNKKAADSTEAYEAIQNEVQRLNQELDTANSRIQELNEKSNLTFVEQDELQKLKDTNEELERTLKLKEADANIASKKARKDTLDALENKTSYKSYTGWENTDTTDYQYGLEKMSLSKSSSGTTLENVQKQLADYDRYITQKEALDKRLFDMKIANPEYYMYDAEYSTLQAASDTLDGWISKLELGLSETNDTLSQFKDSLDPSQDTELIASINNFQDSYTNTFANTAKTATQAFNDIWNSADFTNSKKALEAMAKAGELTPDSFTSVEGYQKLLDSTGRSAESVIEQIKSGINDVEDSVINIPKSFTDIFSSLPMDTLEEYITLVKDGIIDEKTISSYSDLASAMTQTGTSAEEAIKAIKKFSEGFKSSIELSKSVQDSYNIFEKVKKEISETKLISLDSLSSIAKQFPELTTATAEYAQGLISTADLMTLLEQAYNNDADAFRTAMANKLAGNEDFFNTIKVNNEGLFDNLAKAYGLDVDNWKSMAQAKAEIDQQLIQNLSSAWSKYYNIVFDSVSGLASMSGGPDLSRISSHGTTATPEVQKAWSEANKQVNKYNQIINALNEAAQIEISVPDFGGIGKSKSGTGSKDKKQFSDELNYIDRLLSESDKRLKWFNNELEDALTIDEKDSAITKIVNETEYQLKQMNDVYAYYSKAASDKLAQIPEAMRESVKNGAVDIESLNDENLSNLIKEFYDLDGEAEDAQDKIRDLNKSIKDMAQQRIQIRIDFLEDKNAKLNTRLDKYKAMISAVISGIEGEMDDVNKHYDRQVDKINEQIEALESQQKVYQDQLDELNKQNEALEIQKALEDALYAKRKAENNKNVRIYREGQGFVQEADQDAIKDANDQYDEAQFNKKKYDLQSQIDAFDEQIDGLNDAIDKLEKARDSEIDYLQSIKDAWDDVEKSAERIANMEMADDFFGDGWFSDIMNGDSSYLDDITEKFQTTYSAISDNQQQIDSLNAIKDTLANVDTATAMNMANMATGYMTLGNTAVTQSNNVNAATGTIPVLTEENRLLNEESMLLWGENFQTFGAQASGVADSIATSYESMASRLEAAAARAVSAIKRIKRAERDDDDDDGYAVGTKNAKPGLRRVAENGPEAITRNDGTVLLATKEQLYPFEGGEKVDTAGETTALLRPINRARLAELTATPPIADRGFTITDEMSRKVLENLSYMPTFDVPKMDYSQFAVKSQERPVTVTIGDVVLHEVDDVDKLGRAIVNRLPGVVSQGIAKK